MRTQPAGTIEIWGGVECTVNRVGDRFYDQFQASGHDQRLDDLHMIADLGIAALRYPLLWERLQPRPDAEIDWRWGDARLGLLRDRGVRPIVGLCHHGSGPAHTNLLERSFAPGLADYAGAVARQYPWIDAYTPVNEPLTTARFSALYGHWYPHARDPCAFGEALLNECEATVRAMRAIRQVNPQAQLIQTEDIGKTHSTPELAYQADFENERRWITWDLLCGRVDANHPLWSYFQWCGIAAARLEWFLDNPCPPNVIGINYYITSERYLDERLDRYPAISHGGNHKGRYADVEAVRVLLEGVTGVGGIIQEAWERYNRPLAITEVHLGCTREEQMRWLLEAWHAARHCRDDGVDIRAITAWSLLGAYDWDSLLTRWQGRYEPGLFDLRSPAPRPTALAGVLRSLARGEEPSHPVLATPGWWRRSERLLYSIDGDDSTQAMQRVPPELAPKVRSCREAAPTPLRRPLLITGGRGTLARAFARICETRGIDYCVFAKEELDIADASQVDAAIKEQNPWALINAAGFADVDRAEAERHVCRRANRLGPSVLANACGEREVRLLTFSSALVFDGQQQRPYKEQDATCPLNVYGRDKEAAEHDVLERLPAALVVRTGAFFGPWDEKNFVARTLATASAGGVVRAPGDAILSPSYLPDLVHACLDLLIDGETGLWHLSNGAAVTWAELARGALVAAGTSTDRLVECATADLGLIARRPPNSALGSSRCHSLLPDLDDALHRFGRERRAAAVC